MNFNTLELLSLSYNQLKHILKGAKIIIQIKNGDEKNKKVKTQKIQGIVIKLKKNQDFVTITLANILDNVSFEYKFILNSPNILNIEIIKKNKIRRSKLTYLIKSNIKLKRALK